MTPEEIVAKLKEEGFCFNQSKERLVIRAVEETRNQVIDEVKNVILNVVEDERYKRSIWDIGTINRMVNKILEALKSNHSPLIAVAKNDRYQRDSGFEEKSICSEDIQTPDAQLIPFSEGEKVGVRSAEPSGELCTCGHEYYEHSRLFNIKEKKGRICLRWKCRCKHFEPKEVKE